MCRALSRQAERYQQVVPARNHSGRRIFSRHQVERLKFVRAQIADGASAADAHRVLAEMTESGRALTIAGAKPSPQLLILLAESDPYAAKFGEYFLKTEGFAVEVALGEETARDRFAQTSPAVVVVEVLISGGAGLELCRFFKAHSGVSVMAVSAVQARDAALDAGADAFLLKPLDPLQLVSTVRDLLRSRAFLAKPQLDDICVLAVSKHA